MIACFGRIFGRDTDVAGQLASPERVTRLHALKTLLTLSHRAASRVESQLVVALQSKDAEEREAARTAVRTHYELERLRRRLGHPSVAEQTTAAWLLSAFEDDSVIASLLFKAETAPDQSTRDTCIEVLAHHGGEAVITAAVEELGKEDAQARIAGTRVLTALGDQANAMLLRALRDPRRHVRLGAVRALEVVGAEAVAEALHELLGDPVEEVRAEAARVLAERQSESACAPLVAALSDPSVMVRLQAAAALARLPDEEAARAVAEFIRALAADPDFEVADRELLAAVAAMDQLPPSLFQELLGGKNEQFAINLALALEEAGTVTRWLTRLHETDAKDRLVLLDLLKQVGLLGVREPFMSGLGMASPELRATSAWLLGECKHPQAVAALVGLLCDSEASVRRRAAQALGKLLDPLAVPGLLESLGDPDQAVRSSAVEALSGLLVGNQEQPVVEAQEGALVPVGTNAMVPTASAISLPAIPSRYGLPIRFSDALGRLAMDALHSHDGEDGVLTSASALVRCLRDPSWQVREKAADSVGQLRLTSAAGTLMERALHDSEARVRTAAARALARLPGGDYTGALVRALEHSDPGVRCRAAEALGECGARHAAPELIKALGDTHPMVRQRAARALWQVATGDMADALLEHLHSPDPKVRSAVTGTLGKLHATQALEPIANRLEDPNQFVRASALNALGNMGSAAASCLPRVAGAIHDPDPFVRARAVEALGAIGTGQPGQVFALLDASRDDDSAVAERALHWLVQLANGGVLRPIVDALATPDYQHPVRMALERVELPAMRNLLRLSREVNEETSKVLLAVISEVLRKRGSLEECRLDLLSLDPTVRLAGLESLGLLKRPEATELIVDVLFNDPLPTLRERAAAILADLEDPVGLAALHRARAQSPVSGNGG